MLLVQCIVSISDMMITPFIGALGKCWYAKQKGWLISTEQVILLTCLVFLLFQWMSSHGHCCETKILTLCAHLSFHPHASPFALTFQSCFFQQLGQPVKLLATAQKSIHMHIYAFTQRGWLISSADQKHVSFLLYFRVAYEWGCSTASIHFWFTSTQEPNPHIFFLCQPGIDKASWGHKCDLKERPYYNNKDWGTGSVTYSCSLDMDVTPNTLLLSYSGLLLWWPSLMAW